MRLGSDASTHTQSFYVSSGFRPDYPGEPVPRRWNWSGFTGARDSE